MYTNLSDSGRDLNPVDHHGTQTAIPATGVRINDLRNDRTIPYEERRKHPRRECDIAARVKLIDPLVSLSPSAPARVLNRSADGLKIRVARPVLVGALVHVRMAGQIFGGEVRYCMSNGTEFDIGVRIVQTY
jgi:hypothetical protein